MGGLTLVGNTGAFPGASSGLFYPRPVFLLAQQNVQIVGVTKCRAMRVSLV